MASADNVFSQALISISTPPVPFQRKPRAIFLIALRKTPLTLPGISEKETLKDFLPLFTRPTIVPSSLLLFFTESSWNNDFHPSFMDVESSYA